MYRNVKNKFVKGIGCKYICSQSSKGNTGRPGKHGDVAHGWSVFFPFFSNKFWQ